MAIAALIGRPNVGKSSLFNRLIGERRSIEAEEAGTTRDRVYGQIVQGLKSLTVVDLAGILGPDESLQRSISEQITIAEAEADIFILVVDGKEGLLNEDRHIANHLRSLNRPVVLVINKTDNMQVEQASGEFYTLGFDAVIFTSAIHNSGISDLTSALLKLAPPAKQLKNSHTVRVALIGRPNVGKSSLLNRLVGEARAITSAQAGTTRDTVDAVIEYKNVSLVFVDTAGIRRSGKIAVGIEKFAVLRAVRAVEQCDVAVLLIDATTGPSAGDTHIAGLALDYGRGLILAVNKWDVLRDQTTENKTQGHEEFENLKLKINNSAYESEEDILQRKFLDRLRIQFAFIPWAPVVFISALNGLHTAKLLETVRKTAEARSVVLENDVLASIKQAAEATHTHLPLIYALEQPRADQPTFVLTVNKPATWHFSQRRFMENVIRQAYPFNGTPIKIVLEAYKKSQR